MASAVENVDQQLQVPQDHQSLINQKNEVEQEEDQMQVCGDAVIRILAQPKEEMSIVQLMNADPKIREILMRKQPKEDQLQRENSVASTEGEEDDSSMSIECSSVVGIQESALEVMEGV